MTAKRPQYSVVQARIDKATKELAAEVLAGMGHSISDAIRLLLVSIAEDRRFPFLEKMPNATALRAIEELEAGKGHRCGSVNEMMAALNTDD